MSAICTNENTKSVAIYAQVTRKDGTQGSNLLRAFYHKNPVLNFIVNKYIQLRDRL